MSVFVLPDPDTVTLGGLRFAALTEGEVVHRVRTALARGIGGRIATPNVDILRQAALDASIRKDLENADLLVADGAPLVWAARLSGTPLPERVTGSGLIWALSAGLAIDGSSVFLLGGDPASNGAGRAAARLLEHYPGLRIAGTASPRYGFDAEPRSLQKVLSRVVEAEPDLVFVGLGFPKQERLIEQLRPVLPSSWFLGCGAAINFVAGDARRAPVWMQRTGLEWAHRLASEPRRLGRRYLREDAPFAVRLLASSALRRDRVRDDDEFFALLTPDEGRAWNARYDEEAAVPDHVASAAPDHVASAAPDHVASAAPDHVASGLDLDVPQVEVKRRPRPRPHR